MPKTKKGTYGVILLITFINKTENYIFLQWSYFIEKFKEMREKTKEEFEYFVKSIRKNNKP